MLEWLGDVGGNLGLFIGASVFTVIEFIIVFNSMIGGCFTALVNRFVKA